MEDFPNASAYCQRLKGLSDQLRNVRAPVDNNQLVLQLVSGLTKPYNGVATLIRQSSPLPQFYQARSMLTLEEAGLEKRAATASGSASALLATSHDGDSSLDGSGNARGKSKHQKKNFGRKGQNGGGRGSAAGGSPGSGAGGSGSGAGRGGVGQQQQWGMAPNW
ncbi:keratin, type I cytoskeletal 9-like [Chenopodium quinoa]|uniref:keratin, type I cytoskeletal 9-like n=1 Tax=Chenopodium quinoa TaxID=63459 RepID=UPI000B773CB1|nr:keratin, type I cytoskeletal 9-like [Chenopodium quinoa]